MATIHKLHQNPTDEQLDAIKHFNENHKNVKVVCALLFETDDGYRQMGISLPSGIDYMTMLGAVELLRDKILQEMRHA